MNYKDLKKQQLKELGMNKVVTAITQLHKRNLTYTVDGHTTPLQFIGDAITDYSNETQQVDDCCSLLQINEIVTKSNHTTE